MATARVSAAAISQERHIAHAGNHLQALLAGPLDELYPALEESLMTIEL